MNINKITTDTGDNIRHNYQPKQSTSPRAIVPLAIIAGSVTIAVWVLLLIVTSIGCTSDYQYECPSFTVALWSLPTIIATGLVMGLLATVPLVLQAARNAEYLQVRGVRLHRDDIRQYAPQLITVEAVSAKSEATAGLDALTLHHTPTVASVAPVPSEKLLEASEQSDLVIAPGEWLTWLNRQPHVILAAETGGGKSTTAKAILEPRIKAQEDILIIDPHSSQWFDLPSYGGGENWNEITDILQTVSNEYRKRLEERDKYKTETGSELPVNHFKRLTVLLDEANNARAALDKGRDNNPWQSFTKTLGSGARKVGISVVLLCQSANVEDLGLSGAMRQNFTRIAMDDRTIKLMISADEKDNERRKKLYTALIDRPYPAACEMNGRVYILDRTGLDKVSITTAKNCAWNISISDVKSAEKPLMRDTDTIDTDDETVIAIMLRRGLSANKIYDMLGGNRNARMMQISKIKERLGE